MVPGACGRRRQRRHRRVGSNGPSARPPRVRRAEGAGRRRRDDRWLEFSNRTFPQSPTQKPNNSQSDSWWIHLRKKPSDSLIGREKPPVQRLVSVLETRASRRGGEVPTEKNRHVRLGPPLLGSRKTNLTWLRQSVCSTERTANLAAFLMTAFELAQAGVVE